MEYVSSFMVISILNFSIWFSVDDDFDFFLHSLSHHFFQLNLLQSLKYGKFNLTLRIQFSEKIPIKESFAHENIFFSRDDW